MKRSQPRAGRVGQRGSAVVAVLILLAATLLVVVGARLFGGAAVLQFRCQGDAVRAIGSGSPSGCGDARQPASPGGSRLHAGSGAQGTSPPGAPPPDDDQTPEHQAAQETLAPLFEIVASGVESTAQNQVSEEEFEEVVDLYDAILDERTHIQHNRRAAPYWDTITADLARILQTLGGRELLDRLAHATRWTLITIAFVRNQDGEPDPDLGLDPSNGAAWYEDPVGYVEYVPGESVHLPGADLELDPWALMRSDVVLYHELRHVLDFFAGTGEPGNLREDGERVPVMEYQAVGLGDYQDRMMSENAYRAARREIGELGVGAAIGDADMPLRPRYRYRAVPPVGPPPAR